MASHNGQSRLEILRGYKRSQRCICGRPKQAGPAFCRRCNSCIPDSIRPLVRSSIEANEAEGFEHAVRALEDSACYLRQGTTDALFGERSNE
jgi:hypothetical protein